MSNWFRGLLCVLFFMLACIYAIPNIALMFGVVLTVYNKIVSAAFCMMFAITISNLVKSLYENRSKNETRTNGKTDRQIFKGDGYSYFVEDGQITFTFECVEDHDGRQLNRLKFMREKFFKDR